MICAMSGHVPEEPVVSTKSGHVFEKRLVTKHIQETGTDPITGESCTLDDLLPIKNNKTIKPRTSPATSIPGLLGLFHNEWDALMLETHNIRQNNNLLRQELSHALYEHDAACRVIARLQRENAELKRAVEDLNARQPVAEAAPKRANDEDADGPSKRAKAGITPDIVAEMTTKNSELSKSRKKRTVPESTAKPEDISQFSLLGSFPVHSTTKGGILSIDVHPDNENVLATAGADATVQLYDWKETRTLGQLTGHTKRINSVQYANADVLLTASDDKSVRIWRGEGGNYNCSAVLTDHSDAAVAVAVHPLRKYFVSASADKTWCFYDLEGLCFKQVDPVEAVKGGYTCAQFHPDGVILGAGSTDKVVHIWEVREQKHMAQFPAHSSPIKAISFSENGYYLASCAEDGVRLWDLRKLKNTRTVTPYESFGTTAVTFDHSGNFLACGGEDARVYGLKQDWAVLNSFSDMPKKGVQSLKFGKDAQALFVGAADHNLRVFTRA